jgi:hypothetical protein
MLKIFTLLFIGSLTSLMAYTNFAAHQSKVLKVDATYLYVNDSNNFKVGSSGVVIHSFDQSHKTIVATVEVVEKKDAKALLKYKNFTALKQNALPDYKITPTEGDTVILNYLYDRAMAIVPNAETLQSVTNRFSSIDWVHPDIFGSKLAIDYTPIPSKKEFQEECSQNSFSLLFFAIEDKGYFVDCNTFKVLSSADITNQETKPTIKPFYTRVYKEIKNRVFGTGNIGDYATYYKTLLGLK